jgi:hypothetical protein
MGDEMSKRQKFLFLTWVGPSVGVIRRAKMSTDKAMVKEIIMVSVPYKQKEDYGTSNKSVVHVIYTNHTDTVLYLFPYTKHFKHYSSEHYSWAALSEM